jgi:hypothetical protein
VEVSARCRQLAVKPVEQRQLDGSLRHSTKAPAQFGKTRARPLPVIAFSRLANRRYPSEQSHSVMFAPNLKTPKGFRIVFVGAFRVRFPANMRPDEQAQGVSGIRFHGSIGETEGFGRLAGPGKDRRAVSVDSGSAASAPNC